MDKVKKFAEMLRESEHIVFFGGTSLAVYPAASFIDYFRGKYIVVINKSETGLDGKADLVFSDSIGKVFSEAMILLRGDSVGNY